LTRRSASVIWMYASKKPLLKLIARKRHPCSYHGIMANTKKPTILYKRVWQFPKQVHDCCMPTHAWQEGTMVAHQTFHVVTTINVHKRTQLWQSAFQEVDPFGRIGLVNRSCHGSKAAKASDIQSLNNESARFVHKAHVHQAHGLYSMYIRVCTYTNNVVSTATSSRKFFFCNKTCAGQKGMYVGTECSRIVLFETGVFKETFSVDAIYQPVWSLSPDVHIVLHGMLTLGA
jgi:hypothetical protein